MQGTLIVDDSDSAFLSGGRFLVGDAGTLTFSPDLVELTSELVLTGTATADLARLQVNNGAIRLLDGADLTIDPSGTNGFENRGILDLSATSTLTIEGDVTFGGVSQPVIRSEIASATDFGRVVINGSLDLNSPDSTSRFDPDLVGGFDPEVGDSFAVITASGGVSNGFDSFQGGEDPSGDVLAVSRPDGNTVAVTIVPGPLPPAPQILGQSFEFEERLAVTFDFDQDVSAFLSRSDYTITNVDTNDVLPQSAGVLSFNTTSNQAVLDLTGDIPNGNYELVVEASDIANGAGVPASGAPIVLDFFVLAGDANRDRTVNLADFGILRANFNASGATFSQADFNYDGNVDLGDFGILRNNFAREPARHRRPPSSPAKKRRSSRRQLRDARPWDCAGVLRPLSLAKKNAEVVLWLRHRAPHIGSHADLGDAADGGVGLSHRTPTAITPNRRVHDKTEWPMPPAIRGPCTPSTRPRPSAAGSPATFWIEGSRFRCLSQCGIDATRPPHPPTRGRPADGPRHPTPATGGGVSGNAGIPPPALEGV